MARVSIIMTVRNGEKYLTEAISSMLEQTFVDTEMIIVNNGSTDNTSTILKNINDPRLKIITVDPDPNNTFASGISKAFKAATGEYIAVQDSDDISYKSRIEEQVCFLETHQEVGLVGSRVNVINKFGEHLFTSQELPKSSELMQKYTEGNFLAHSTIMFRRELVNGIGGYNLHFEYACDYRMALDILFSGHKISAINKPLVKSRRHAEQETAQQSTIITQNQNLLSLLKYAQKLPFLTKESLLKGRRQITKAKFQATLNLFHRGSRLEALQLFGTTALRSPFYLIAYALTRAMRGQLNGAPQPKK
jgi:glycosyltransferase involved in cell wall biosynthesis